MFRPLLWPSSGSCLQGTYYKRLWTDARMLRYQVLKMCFKIKILKYKIQIKFLCLIQACNEPFVMLCKVPPWGCPQELPKGLTGIVCIRLLHVYTHLLVSLPHVISLMQGHGLFKTRVTNYGFLLFRKSGAVCSEIDVRDASAGAPRTHQITFKVVLWARSCYGWHRGLISLTGLINYLFKRNKACFLTSRVYNYQCCVVHPLAISCAET
jgi:hypothetical protein